MGMKRKVFAIGSRGCSVVCAGNVNPLASDRRANVLGEKYERTKGGFLNG